MSLQEFTRKVGQRINKTGTGFMMHPETGKRGEEIGLDFFSYYTDGNGNTQVERWQVDANNPDLADPSSAETILTVEQPYPHRRLVLNRKPPVGVPGQRPDGDVLDDSYRLRVIARFEDYKGRWLVFFFYPLDFTFV